MVKNIITNDHFEETLKYGGKLDLEVSKRIPKLDSPPELVPSKVKLVAQPVKDKIPKKRIKSLTNRLNL
jgi:hypothetical protein